MPSARHIEKVRIRQIIFDITQTQWCQYLHLCEPIHTLFSVRGLQGLL